MAAGSAAGQTPDTSGTGAHPGNDYYVNLATGTIQRQSNPIAGGLLRASGFWGPVTWAQAKNIATESRADISAATSGAIAGATGNVGPAVPADPLTGIAAALEAFWSAVTDGKMWRSVWWIVLGAWLLFSGLLLWLKIPQRAAGLAGKAAEVAPAAAAL